MKTNLKALKVMQSKSKRKASVHNCKLADIRRRKFPDYNFSKLRIDDRNLIPSCPSIL
jgi:hypothetical protein